MINKDNIEGELHFIPYNTGMPQIKLHEYGRNIQSLVEYCVSIPDREERTQCAYAIADVVATLNPRLKGNKDGMKNIWDQLNIMSGFRLDIDFPCEVITEENLNPKPERLPYTSSNMRGRHYGKHIENMIRKVSEMEAGDEKDMLIAMIANHMKKLMLTHNKEGVSDAKILRDFEEYSEGSIILNPETYVLHEFREYIPKNQPKKTPKQRKRK